MAKDVNNDRTDPIAALDDVDTLELYELRIRHSGVHTLALMQPVTAADRKAGKGRLLGVDAARAVALIGMMAVHLLPSTDADGSISTAYFLASGRASALFAVLAGVGLSLATGGTEPPTGRSYWATVAGVVGRAVVLGVLGLFLGDLDSGVAVILVNYGFLFLIASFFLHMTARKLWLLAAVWAVFVPVVSHWLRADWPPSSFEVTGFDSLADPVRMLREVFFTGYYPVFSWVAYLLSGLAAGRMKLASNRVAAILMGVGVTLALGSLLVSRFLLDVLGGRKHVGELPVQFFGVTPTDSWWYLGVATPHSGTPLDFAHTVGSSFVILGGLLLLASVGRIWVAWLAAAGGMTLSLYTVHVLALTAGWGQLDDLADRGAGLLALLAWHAVLALIIGMIWRAFIGRGPLETLAANISGFIRGAVLASRSPNPRAS